MDDHHVTWLEISTTAFKRNLKTVRRLAGTRKIAAAVKANAYGHGLREIISLLAESDIEYIALHSCDEAERARRYGWNRAILMVGYLARGQLEAVFDLNLEPTVYNLETIRRLGRLSERYRAAVDLHLKIETGTNRQGVEPARLDKFVAAVKKHPRLRLRGVSTHFANIEDTTDHSYAAGQLKLFSRAVTRLRGLGLKPKLRHTACSAALLLFDNTKFELVRPGIALYGLWPSKETYLSYRLQGGTNRILEPALSWRTRVVQVKEVPADAFIGYGCTYRTTSKTKLAVLPVGYYDGYDRGLSNLAYVLIRGRRAPVRGRICMNLMMVDITDIGGVRLEDTVTLLGTDGTEYIGADLLADWAQTVNYEIISRINERLPRVIV